MRILVTGSSGWLGATLVPKLKAGGHAVVGLDPSPGAATDIVGSVADRALVRAVLGDHRIDAVVHSGALHKPNIETHAREDFLEVNVRGTFNLLEEAAAQGVSRFVFTLHDVPDGEPRDPRGEGGRRRLADGRFPSHAAQHLWRDQARGRASVPAGA